MMLSGFGSEFLGQDSGGSFRFRMLGFMLLGLWLLGLRLMGSLTVVFLSGVFLYSNMGRVGSGLSTDCTYAI